MRALWSGTLDLGLLSIPVKLYSAVSEEMPFRLLHKADLAPVRYERVCTRDGKVLAWDEVVKGYEYEEGRYAPIEPRDVELARGVEIDGPEIVALECVPRRDVGLLAFGTPYVLAPARGGATGYAVVREALARTAMVAIVRVSIRARPYLALLFAERDALALAVLRTAATLRAVESLPLPARRPREQDVRLAQQLVEQMAVGWDPSRYRDEYHARLRALVEQRVAGKGTARRRASTRALRAAGATSLVAALRASLASLRSEPAAPEARRKTRAHAAAAKQSTAPRARRKRA